MTARFAGSRSLDERRRRRLAGERDESGCEAAAENRAGESNPPPGEPPARRGRRRKPARRLPLRRLISPRLWKHGLLASLVLAVGAGLIWAGFESRAIGNALGDEAGELVSFERAGLIRGYSGLLLLVAAEFALLIWYVRSRSQRDFSGRYRSWAWAAGVGFLFSASVTLELHRVWSAMLRYSLNLEIPHIGTLCWLAPALGCGSVLLRDLYADMRDCRSSVACLRLALLGWTISAVQLLGYGPSVDARWEPLVIAAAAMFGHYCLFLSMLLHTRFVIFVSAEPPDARPALIKSALSVAARPLRRCVRAIRRKRKRRPNGDPEEAVADRNSEAVSPGSDQPTHKTKKRRKKSKPEREHSKSNKPAEATANMAGDESATENPQPEKTLRADAAHSGTAMPKGLSKRERRRLRKKQAQRKP